MAPPQRSWSPLWAVAISMSVLLVVAVVYKRHRRGQRLPVATPAVAANQIQPPIGAPVPAPARPSPAIVPANPAALAPASPPGAPPAATTPPLLEEAAALPAPRLSVSSYWYEGAQGHRQALAEQQRARAPMLVYFRVDWCPYCKRMDAEVLPAPAVQRFLADVVKVRVNPETSPDDLALANRYGASRFPSVFVIPVPDGRPERVSHFSRSGTEHMDVTAEKFVKACQSVGLGQSRQLVNDGAAKARNGDHPGARADLDRAIELDPRNAQAFFWRGHSHARAGESGKAIGDLKRAIDLDPEDPFAYAELGALYNRAGHFEEGIGTLTRLTEVAPDWQQGTAFALRGHAYGRKGEVDRAMADFAEACKRGHSRACTARRPGAP